MRHIIHVEDEGIPELISLFDFENKGVHFPGVHSSYKFCLFTAGSGAQPAADRAEFAFFAHAVEGLRDPERRFMLSPEDIELLNPNTRTCPTFRSRQDAELAKAIYRRVPVLLRKGEAGRSRESPWGVQFRQGLFNMTSDSRLFRTREQLESDGWQLAGNVFHKNGTDYLPLYEAKMIHHFDHRWASFRIEGGKDVAVDVPSENKQEPEFIVLPRYWVILGDGAGRSSASRESAQGAAGRATRSRYGADCPRGLSFAVPGVVAPGFGGVRGCRHHQGLSELG